MHIEQRPIASITPYPGNPRQNDGAVQAVARSIAEFGFRQPIVVDQDLVVICGHTRLKAAQELGMAEVPIVVAADLSSAQIKAYRLADNKTAELSRWDYDLLPIELRDLQDTGFDMDLLGFDGDELAKLLDPGVADGLTDPDEAPPVPEEPITRPGDIWQLGEHRLICGDSCQPQTYDRLLAGEQVHLLQTDPPYNVAYQGGTDEALTIANDDMDAASYRQFLVAALGCAAAALQPGAGFYVWHADTYGGIVRSACEKVDLPVRQCLIWKKNSLVLGRQDYQWIHEPCLYGWKPGAAHRWLGDRAQTTVLEHDKPKRNGEHPTMKPVELLTRMLGNSSGVGDVVLDPFGGSGSTLIAAQQTGRQARLVELDPRYCDVIVRRWEAFTGKTAQRIRSDVAAVDGVAATQGVG
ncbi:MAG: DNA modification methylase [Planctomycetota bacterium]